MSTSLTLFDNAFSPFARKVRLVLDLKGLRCEAVDGLAIAHRDRLLAVNGRVEVPVLLHEGRAVVNSADIVAYLDRAFPERPVAPLDLDGWTRARAWERCADTTLDPILVDISLWKWAERPDAMPEGLLEAARRDLARIYAALERDLEGRDFLAGGAGPGLAEAALFPHLAGTRWLGVPYDPATTPRLHGWLQRLRAHPAFAADLARTRAYLQTDVASTHEVRKVFWRGDRLEWILARGFHGWLVREIEEERVLWPGLGVP